MDTEVGKLRTIVLPDLFVSVRLKTGYSQKDLAEMVGICTRQWQYVESAERDPAGSAVLGCLAIGRPDILQLIVQASREGLPKSKFPSPPLSSGGPGAGFGGRPA